MSGRGEGTGPWTRHEGASPQAARWLPGCIPWAGAPRVPAFHGPNVCRSSLACPGVRFRRPGAPWRRGGALWIAGLLTPRTRATARGLRKRGEAEALANRREWATPCSSSEAVVNNPRSPTSTDSHRRARPEVDKSPGKISKVQACGHVTPRPTGFASHLTPGTSRSPSPRAESQFGASTSGHPRQGGEPSGTTITLTRAAMSASRKSAEGSSSVTRT
jgi:hypothetical protein